MRGLLQIYFNAQLFWIFSPLVGSQEGLSISPLCIEKSISKITLMPRSCTTAGCTKSNSQFWSQTNVSDGTFPVDYELWAIDTKQPKIIRFSLFLFMFETDTGLEHEKIIFHQNYNIFMYLLRVCLDRIVISRFCIYFHSIQLIRLNELSNNLPGLIGPGFCWEPTNSGFDPGNWKIIP